MKKAFGLSFFIMFLFIYYILVNSNIKGETFVKELRTALRVKRMREKTTQPNTVEDSIFYRVLVNHFNDLFPHGKKECCIKTVLRYCSLDPDDYDQTSKRHKMYREFCDWLLKYRADLSQIFEIPSHWKSLYEISDRLEWGDTELRLRDEVNLPDGCRLGSQRTHVNGFPNIS